MHCNTLPMKAKRSADFNNSFTFGCIYIYYKQHVGANLNAVGAKLSSGKDCLSKTTMDIMLFQSMPRVLEHLLQHYQYHLPVQHGEYIYKTLIYIYRPCV